MGVALRAPQSFGPEPRARIGPPRHRLRVVPRPRSALGIAVERLGPTRTRWFVASLTVLAAVAAWTMSMLEHLDDLRKRLVVSSVAIIVGVLVAFAFIEPLSAFFLRPLQEMLPAGGRLIFTEPTEAFLVYVKIAGLAGLGLAAPVVFHQLWLFVAPGLYAREKKLAIPFVALSTLGFIGWALFSHFAVFPVAWRFFASFETDFIEFAPRISPVFSLYVRMMLAFALVFQMPTLALFLSRVGVITPRFLIRHFKHAVLGVFVVAAVATPTTDPTGQLLMAGPMLVLYGLSIGIAWAFGKRRNNDDEGDDDVDHDHEEPTHAS